ncbi:hypothetical protein [Pseudoxanthomonas sp. UTMC 1351]|uniref:hypothetical protein n=1 Tax=Pseudoxanthomonas sp. UTMC 1351 TaxID=2695853 RepID=UPI0034CD29D3
MTTHKTPGATWSLTDVAKAAGRSKASVRLLASKLLPAELLAERAGRGAAVQLPESVALALVDAMRIGVLDPQLVEEMKKDPAAAVAAAEGMAALARLLVAPATGKAA